MFVQVVIRCGVPVLGLSVQKVCIHCSVRKNSRIHVIRSKTARSWPKHMKRRRNDFKRSLDEVKNKIQFKEFHGSW